MKWLTIFFPFFLLSCSSLKKNNPKIEEENICEAYYEHIMENFKADTLGIFSLDDLFPLGYKNHSVRERNDIISTCIIGKTRQEIIDIFGEPSFSTKTRLDYFFRPECIGEGSFENLNGCLRFKIYLDSDEIADQVPAIIVEPGQGG